MNSCEYFEFFNMVNASKFAFSEHAFESYGGYENVNEIVRWVARSIHGIPFNYDEETFPITNNAWENTSAKNKSRYYKLAKEKYYTWHGLLPYYAYIAEIYSITVEDVMVLMQMYKEERKNESNYDQRRKRE